MPTESLTDLYRSGYYIALALGIASLFDFVPTWVPLALLVAAYILHWQCNARRSTLAKEAENKLYDRYAPDLQTRDPMIVLANIAERIHKLTTANSSFAAACRQRINDLNAHFGKAAPLPIVHALLRDFEFAVAYLNVPHPDAIEKSKVLVERTANIKRWLTLVGAPPTQEEMDGATRAMLASIRSKSGNKGGNTVK
jgi:hypothetical protein